MSTKEKAKPASKKKFSKDDVKTLYKAIERGWKEDALSLAFAASGSYKVYQRGSGYRSTGYTTQYWPMQLAIDKGDIELLEACRPYVDILKEVDELDDSWFRRAWRDDKAKVAALFMSWLPDFRDDDGKWLRIAAANRSMKLIELVLPVSNPLGKSDVGQTPLMTAASAMCVEAVERLLPLSDPNAVDDKGLDALMHALEGLLRRAKPNTHSSHHSPPKDVMACFQSLIDACGVHRRDASGMSAMSRLVQKSGYSYGGSGWISLPSQFAELLLAAGAVADETEAGGESMLMKAITAGDKELFEQLLPSSKLNRVDGEGFTPLLKAAKLGRSEMVAKLAPLSECDQQSSDGSTALMLSAQRGDLESARLLCDMTDSSLRDAQGRTAAMIAAEKLVEKDVGKDGLLVFLRLFEPASAKGQCILPWLVGIPELFEAALPFCDPNDKDTNGQIALHRAIKLGDRDAFERLLPISDIKATDDKGVTPLMLSIRKLDTGMFHALLPASDAKAIDAEGKTALMIAAKDGGMEIAAALMPASDADAVDHKGKAALMHAMEGWRYDEELILFLAERSDLSMINEAGRAAMDEAMKSSRFPQDAALKLRGMMSARSERDELLSAVAEPTNPSGKRKIDAFYAAPKVKKRSGL